MYATESCFGIGCDPSNIKAIKKIIGLKKRNNKKNFILISASIDNASNYIKQLNKVDLKEVNKKWPGPHTWLLESKNNCPKWLQNNNKLALRIPSLSSCNNLCSSLGIAIVSTSANHSGKKSLTKYRDVSRQFHKKAKIIKGRIGKEGKPSTIQDLRTGKIIRV